MGIKTLKVFYCVIIATTTLWWMSWDMPGVDEQLNCELFTFDYVILSAIEIMQGRITGYKYFALQNIYI